MIYDRSILTLAVAPAGLTALFSSHALQLLMEALADEQIHVRLRAMELLLQGTSSQKSAFLAILVVSLLGR